VAAGQYSKVITLAPNFAVTGLSIDINGNVYVSTVNA
jgi:hypothetical protein